VNIIPVIDLKAGSVVHAVGGDRDAYAPLPSPLFPSPVPADVARKLVEQFQFQQVYVADLDAIAGGEPDWPSLQAIVDVGLQIMLDAGVGEPGRAAAIAERSLGQHRVASVIVAMECLDTTTSLSAIMQAIGPDRAVFSLDLFKGKPVARTVLLQQRTPSELADLVWDAGFRRLIVLDIAAVGKGHGPVTVDVCRQLADRHDWQELISGGGVRGDEDLQALNHAGCHAALVASALHRWPK
jgi:phosphoribosylformimino-5-aminoimidazole carboxamide ribotide isomerase